MNRWFPVAVTFCLSLFLSSSVEAQTLTEGPVVLRKLTLIRQSVVRIEDGGMVVDANRVIPWESIKKYVPGQIDLGQESLVSEVQLRLEKLGEPLFRLRWRLKTKDLPGAAEAAQTLLKNMAETKRNVSAKFRCLAHQTILRQSLQESNRPQALLSLLKTIAAAEQVKELAAEDDLKIDYEQQWSEKLLPVWFSTDGLENLAKQMEPYLDTRPGGQIYLASIQLETGQFPAFLATMDKLNSSPYEWVGQWSQLLLARHAQLTGDTRLARNLLKERKWAGASAAVAKYFLGRMPVGEGIESADTELKRSMLTLLEVPAVYGEQYPDLAYAALRESARLAEKRGSVEEARLLRKEAAKFRRN